MAPESRETIALADREGMDNEHRLQLGLLDAFRAALRDGANQEMTAELLERLVDFTKVHFMSEQVLMRFYGYDGYAGHAVEHDRALEHLEDLRKRFRSGDLVGHSEDIDALARLLTQHIRHSDDRLRAFLDRFGATHLA